MKRVVILGVGTGGTVTAVKLRRALDPAEWEISVVDRDDRHVYQPGLLFVPFGIYGEADLYRSRRRFIPPGVRLVLAETEAIDPEQRQVRLESGARLEYDVLVIATGSRPSAGDTPGLAEALAAGQAHDFYTPRGALALAGALPAFRGGRVMVQMVDMPVKCPVAPLEFAFLAEWYLTMRGLRDGAELVYATSLSGPFTRQRCSDALGGLLAERGIALETDFAVESVDGAGRVVTGFDGRQVPYDLLVSVPIHRGSEVIARSGMGDDLDFVETDPHTLQSRLWPEVFVLGDATDLPSSKAGSVAHFQAAVLVENVVRWIDGLDLEPGYDGHANCFIETGYGKAVLVDFNYDVEPLPGKYPLPGVGPFTLLAESEANHWGKMAFRWAYWNLLLRGADLGAIGPRMALAGKWS